MCPFSSDGGSSWASDIDINEGTAEGDLQADLIHHSFMGGVTRSVLGK